MKSLYGKFILFTIGIMLVSSLLAFLGVNTFYHQKLKVQTDEKNVEIAIGVADTINQTENTELDALLSTIATVGYKIIIVNNAEEVTFYGEDFRVNNLSEQAIQQVLQGDVYHGMRDFPRETFVTGFFADETANTAGVPFEHKGETHALFMRPNIKMLFTEVHLLLGGMFIGMAVISIIGMIFLARQLIKPIVKLTKATKQVSNENFSVNLPTGRTDEIGLLAKSFLAMANEIEAANQLRKQFINDLTHDLQTPLQNIQGYAGLLQDSELTVETQLEYAEIIQTETRRLSTLSKQLLLLTTLDSHTSILFKKRINLAEQIKLTMRKYHWMTDKREISVISEIADCTYDGDPDFLEKVWDNLFSNACKYTQECGLIELHLFETEQAIIFTIKDDGIGIDANQLPHLFDRFYRADSSRQTAIAGTGLGLSIVREVVSLHDGKIDVESALGAGTLFTVTLPK